MDNSSTGYELRALSEGVIAELDREVQRVQAGSGFGEVTLQIKNGHVRFVERVERRELRRPQRGRRRPR